ncbi:50S ribosomal protein L13e [Staphylothermus marinus F1]|uniref:Large ribosomal subunit protein eL13 n=1 Tax=Staphylothermus marinus (strain ATCC 43588 / DSM 3639 / JCM 9404 / F1) TaxID=399550 RepID=A3DKW5_STAMF|nr:50S ribosomal protein L13e [Staphylothermus marinus]ABN69275.1 50S ribosomal protein L13e [Staphylothermus marinus F1]
MSKEIQPPEPIVRKPMLRKHGGLSPGLRVGRGFSKKELEAVGLDLKTAKKLGLRIDKRRRTIHEWNVQALRDYLTKIGYIAKNENK